jgi:hypothetical protein
LHFVIRALLVALLVAAPSSLAAQAQWWIFENRPYFKPFRAAVRDANVSATIALVDRVDYLVKPTSFRTSWDIDLGAELPLFGRESESLVDRRVGPGANAWGFWFPIDFHMIEDLFVDDSNPILNTDYRFGLMFKYIRGVRERDNVGIRAHVGHESTHIGDEFAIVAQRTYPAEFERINVSWEFLDAVVMLDREWEGGALGRVWMGVTTTLPFKDSYYSVDAESVTESPLGPVTTSTNWIDPHMGIEIEREGILFTGKGSLFASVEMRWRSIYDYHKTAATDRERRQLSTNVIVGARKSGHSEYGRFSPFLRLYHGVNPHGQFRNQTGFHPGRSRLSSDALGDESCSHLIVM